MPQSLMIGGDSSSGSSVKRQRSADSRDVPTRSTSTGPNQSDGSLSKSTVRIPSYLDKSKVEISQAFQDLEWKQRFRLFHALENPTTSPFRVDRSEVVTSRNRYGNVQPWDNSRVRLKTLFGGSDYVNASPIVLKSRSTASGQVGRNGDGNKEKPQENRYIATQGPKDGSTLHFWHMVMQETTGDVGVIVMLTQCYESNKEKCSQYFPANMNNPTILLPREDSGYDEEDKENLNVENTPDAPINTVTLQSVTQDVPTRSQIRIFTLTINRQSKTVYHYLFHGWPDFGKPEAEDRVALLELTRQTKRVAGESPRVIHCSAGVGRTGSFIALDFLTREIEEGRILDKSYSDHKEDTTPTTETWGKSGPPKVKTPTGGDFPSGEENQALKDDLIYDTVNTLREQRMMMVMNEVQYAFLYEAIRELFLEKYKARPEGAVVKGVEAGPADLPKGKVAKMVGGEAEGDSGSEAETEIMEGEEDAAKMETEVKTQMEDDPYNTVAPEHIRKGVSKEIL